MMMRMMMMMMMMMKYCFLALLLITVAYLEIRKGGRGIFQAYTFN